MGPHILKLQTDVVPFDITLDLRSFYVFACNIFSNCEHIVQREEKFCLRCQCSYEARNTLLIKVLIFSVRPFYSSLFVFKFQCQMKME